MNNNRFICKKAELNNYFAYWRLGGAHDTNEPWNNPNRPPLAAPYTLIDPSILLSPPARRWDWDRRMYQGAADLAGLFQLQDTHKWDFRLDNRAGSASTTTTTTSQTGAKAAIKAGGLRGQRKDRTPAHVKRVVDGFAPTVRRLGVDIDLVRVLGYGGNGVASLFRISKTGGGTTKKFVLKQTLTPGSNLTTEKATTRVRFPLFLFFCLFVISPADGRAPFHMCLVCDLCS